MTDRPSDRAIAQAFEIELAKLPAGAQQNIRDAVARGESLSWDMFRAGWFAAAPDGAQAVDDQAAAWLLLRVLQQAGPYSRELIDRTKRAMENIPRVPSQDAEDAARYRHARNNHLGEMLAIYPTPDTSDVGLDYAIDAARNVK